MIRAITAAILCAIVSVSALTLTPWDTGPVNFIDDTLMVVYDSLQPCSSALMGISTGHKTAPSIGLYKTLFYKIVPDSAESLAVAGCTLFVFEVDINKGTGDTVYTVVADTSIDTIVIDGSAATDSQWTKAAYTGNPSNGFMAIVKGDASTSTTMNSTLKLWFHTTARFGK